VSFLTQWESGRTRQNLLHFVRESKAKRHTTWGVLPSVVAYGMEQRRAAGTAYGGLCLICPHTGQSSQLSFDANGGGAPFLATRAGSALILPLTRRLRGLARKLL
jgi:hypothetical protein